MEAWLNPSLSHLEEQGAPFGDMSACHQPLWRAESTFKERREVHGSLADFMLSISAERTMREE